MASRRQPILIIGAGISGLTLAQACRKEGLPFRIFERDESPTFRSAGWGLTLNRGLPAFRSFLPDQIVSRLPETYVNQEAVNAGEVGSFTFFNLSTGEAKWKVTPSERIRVSRQRLKKLLLTGLEVEWSMSLERVVNNDHGVSAIFADGSVAVGSLLVGCDGAHSKVRQLVHPESHQNYRLPIRFIGAGVLYPESQIADIRKLDPYYLHGSDPTNDSYLWFSFLEVSSDPDALGKNGQGEKMYRCQIMTSWPYREGFLGRAEPTEMPNTKTGQLSMMRTLSNSWLEPFRSIVHNIPSDSEIIPVELSDFVPQMRIAPAFAGRVLLLGDACHAMVMYRGEGANQAILDIATLLQQIKPIYQATSTGEDDVRFKNAALNYDTEVRERTEIAVLASRQACLDAHDFKRLDDNSSLFRRQVSKTDL